MVKKSTYQFTFQLPSEVIEANVQEWLRAFEYRYETDKNGAYYVAGDKMFSGLRFFEYQISGYQLTVIAYVRSRKSPIGLDNGMYGVAATAPYRDKLKILFDKLNELSNTYTNGVGNNTNPGYTNVQPGQQNYGANAQGQTIYGGETQNQTIYGGAAQGQQYNTGVPMANGLDEFTKKGEASKGKMAIASFVISLLSLLGSCVGYYGLFIGVFVIFLACGSIKSKKKGFSIAALVISGISILIAIIQIVYQFMSL